MADQEHMNDDERLGAYIDGELEAGEAVRLERRLAAEPALSRRLEQLRAADRLAGRVYRAIDDVPMPEAVVALLGESDVGRDEGPAARVIPIPVRGPRRFLQMPVAIAASVALVAGFLVHDLIGPAPALEWTGSVARHSDLYRLLDTGVSGDPLSLPGGGEGRIVLTFQAGEGDWCRQFRLRTERGEAQGLACRQAGGWQLEMASFAAGDRSGGPYRPAADETPAVLEQAVRDRLGAGEVLGPEAERQLISVGWRDPRG
jgi:hypothetical protein